MKLAVIPLALGWLASSLAGSSLPGASQAAQVRDAVNAAAGQFMADRCHVGLSVVARVRGQSFLYGYGSIRRDRVQRPTPDSVYELASVTKTFTGALAARALIERRMTLDGDFRAYLPGRYPNLAFGGRSFTLRDLATHTSGLQRDLPDSDALMARHDYDHIGDQLAALNKGFGRARSLAALHRVTLRTTPGTSFAYSNIGIRVIGYGLENVYRMPLDLLLQRSIFGPLKMSDTAFTPSPGMRRRLVTPYSRYRHTQPYHDSSAGAAYGLYSTPRDMARYLAWQLDERDPVISRAHTLIRGTTSDGLGLIWNIGEDRGEPMLWHGGGSFGETSQMVFYPKERAGFVLLVNDACDGSEAALKTMALSIHRALNNRTRPPGAANDAGN